MSNSSLRKKHSHFQTKWAVNIVFPMLNRAAVISSNANMVFILVLWVLAGWWGAFLSGSSCHRGLAAVCLWHKSNHAAGCLKIWLGAHTLSCQRAQRESCFIDSIPPSSIRSIRGEQERVSTWVPPVTLQPDIMIRLHEPVMSSLTSVEIVHGLLS